MGMSPTPPQGSSPPNIFSPLQHLLSSSLLECLSLLMDWLSKTVVPLHDGSVLQPASMILMQSAATCIRR